jgi:hypothetical protein
LACLGGGGGGRGGGGGGGMTSYNRAKVTWFQDQDQTQAGSLGTGSGLSQSAPPAVYLLMVNLKV